MVVRPLYTQPRCSPLSLLLCPRIPPGLSFFPHSEFTYHLGDDELASINGIKPLVWIPQGEEREVGSASRYVSLSYILSESGGFFLSRLALAEPHRRFRFGSFFIDSVDPRTCFSSFSSYLAMFTPFEPCFAFSFTLSLFFLKLTSKTNSKSVYKVKHTFDHFYWCASPTSLPLIYSFYFGF